MRRPVLSTLIALLLSLAHPALAEEENSPADSPDAADTSAPAEQTPRQPLEERSEDNAEALERQLPKGEQQMLQAEGSAFLALWKPANAPEAEGVVILVPGANETADWPQAVHPLRSKLPDIAWSSLSLNLPDSPKEPLPEAVLPRTPEPVTVDTADNAAEPATAPAPSQPAAAELLPAPVDPAQRIFARIDAAIAFAEQQDAKDIVLLGHGDGAYWAALYLRERKPEQVKRLVTVAAQRPAGQALALEELIPGLKLATGDFFSKTKP